MGWLPKKHVSFFSHFQFQRISLLYIVHLFCINKQLSDTGSIYKGIKCSLLISWSGSTSPANPSNDIHCMGLCVYAMLHVYAAAIRKER